MHWVKSAEYKSGYEIIIGFENNEVKVVNLEGLITKGIFSDLKDIDKFKKFKVNHDTDTIEWENGADLSPDFLYEAGKSIKKSLKVA